MNNTGNDINRLNYEEYFLLFIDNELKPEQREALNEFLRLNPDLEKELQALCRHTFRPDESITFEEKETLMHFTVRDEMIHPGNIEEYFILYADNELSNTQKAAVEEFVYHHPRYQSEFELIQSVKLEPDRRLIFTGREKLFRSENSPGAIPFYRRWQFAAACVLLLCGSIWLSRQAFISTGTDAELTHGTQVKKPVNINPKTPQPAAATKEYPPVDTAAGGLLAKALNEDKPAALQAVKEKNMTQVKSRSVNKPVRSPDSGTFVFTGKIIRPATGKEIKMSVPEEINPVHAEPPSGSVTRAAYNENTEMNETQILLVNDQPDNSPIHPFNKKQLLRGILRKTTRFLDHQSSIRNVEPTGLKIGNIEIIIQ